MSDEVSGVDLARVALRAAREAAKQNGASAVKPKSRTKRVVRRDGRDPMGLGDALGALIAERAWELPAAGGALRVRWDAIAPHLSDHVAAVGFTAESGELVLCPDSPAWATKARLETPQIIAAANQAARSQTVRSIRVLAPGAMPAPAEPDPPTAAKAVPEVPVRTAETASAGYRRAREAFQASRRKPMEDPAITAARERQIRDRLRGPEGAIGEDQDEDVLEVLRVKRRRSADATHAVALRLARAQKAGLLPRDEAPHAARETA